MENEETMNGKSKAEALDAVVSDPLPCHIDGGGGSNNAKYLDRDKVAEPETPGRRKEILKALEAVERDSAAIAESFSSLFGSLRQSLSQATGSTVEHMNCFSDAAGRLQECVLDASTKGNRYINSCLRLNEEMKDMDVLATKFYCEKNLASCMCCIKGGSYPSFSLTDDLATRKILRRHVDALDSVVSRVVRSP